MSHKSKDSVLSGFSFLEAVLEYAGDPEIGNIVRISSSPTFRFGAGNVGDKVNISYTATYMLE
jgi:hypothetical protein